MNFIHSDPSLELKFTMALDESYNDNSWGFKEFKIYINVCSPYCETCEANPDDCITCISGLNRAVNSDKRCECPDYHFSPEHICIACYATCLTCDGAAENNCLTCNDPDDHRVWNSVTKKCDCKTSYFADGSICSLCHYSCKTCSGGSAKTNCLTCHGSGDNRIDTVSLSECKCKDRFYDNNVL